MSDAAGCGLPPGWRLEVAESLPSTSDALRLRAEAGEAPRLALIARRQTAGRGRSGRAWASPVGNLHLSVLLRPGGEVAEAAQWGLLAGVALAEAASTAEPDPQALRLKWPNDLLRRGAKVAGILAEAALTADRPARLAWVVLGIGVNLRSAPGLPDHPTACLAVAEAPEAFAARLLRRLDHWAAVQGRMGFGPVRDAWMARGPELGTDLAVRGDAAPLNGRYAGLAADGGLLLDTGEGRRHILTGEVLAPARGGGANALRRG